MHATFPKRDFIKCFKSATASAQGTQLLRVFLREHAKAAANHRLPLTTTILPSQSPADASTPCRGRSDDGHLLRLSGPRHGTARRRRGWPPPPPRQVCAAASGQSRRGALARRGDDGTHDTQARETRGWGRGPGGLPLTPLCFQEFSRGRGSRSRVENEAIRFCEFSVTQSPERNLRKRGMVEGFPRRTLCGLCPRGAHAGSGRAAPVWPQGNGQARAPGPAPRSARMNRGPSPPPVGHARLTVPSGT